MKCAELEPRIPRSKRMNIRCLQNDGIRITIKRRRGTMNRGLRWRNKCHCASIVNCRLGDCTLDGMFVRLTVKPADQTTSNLAYEQNILCNFATIIIRNPKYHAQLQILQPHFRTQIGRKNKSLFHKLWSGRNHCSDKLFSTWLMYLKNRCFLLESIPVISWFDSGLEFHPLQGLQRWKK